ncbi:MULTISPECIES: hypothetical protein [unclassified Microcoleus]|uniref:hypothetical protein n=1 Tax=unclassified Microcoleus TaxID=2642155 RepID=UPI002FCEE64E
MAEYFPSVVKSQSNNCPNWQDFEFFQEQKNAAPDSFDEVLLQNTRCFSQKKLANSFSAGMAEITQAITYMMSG